MSKKNESNASLSGGDPTKTKQTDRRITGGIRKRGYPDGAVDDIIEMEKILSDVSISARNELTTYFLRKLSRKTQIEFLDLLQGMAGTRETTSPPVDEDVLGQARAIERRDRGNNPSIVRKLVDEWIDEDLFGADAIHIAFEAGRITEQQS